MRPLLLAALIVLGAAGTSSATAILVLATPGRITLAADARGRIQRDDDATHGPSCKLQVAGRFAVLRGGLLRYAPVAGAEVDLLQPLVDGLRSAPSFEVVDSRLRRWEGNVLSQLVGLASNPSFEALYTDPQALAAVAVAGLDEQHRPRVVVWTVDIVKTHPIQIAATWHSCEDDQTFCPEEGFAAYGSSAATDGPLLRTLNAPAKPAWLLTADAAAARRLLSEEATAAPEEIASPFSIATVTRDGVDYRPAGPCR